MMLDDIVSRGRGGPPGQFHDNANGQNGTVQEIMIPAGKAGLVIGKGGETIKQLQVMAGTLGFGEWGGAGGQTSCHPLLRAVLHPVSPLALVPLHLDHTWLVIPSQIQCYSH